MKEPNTPFFELRLTAEFGSSGRWTVGWDYWLCCYSSNSDSSILCHHGLRCYYCYCHSAPGATTLSTPPPPPPAATSTPASRGAKRPTSTSHYC